MFIFLPDSPVNAPGLTKRERRIAVDRIRENQTGVENKHLKPYQIVEAFKDYKLYMFFILGMVCELKKVASNFLVQLLTMEQAISPMGASLTSELLSSRALVFRR